MNQQIYSDIALRTQGDIYIGVVETGTHRQIHFYQAVYGHHGDPQY